MSGNYSLLDAPQKFWGVYLVLRSWMLYQFGQTHTFGTICGLQQNSIQQHLLPLPTPPPQLSPTWPLNYLTNLWPFLELTLTKGASVVLWPQLKCFPVFPFMCLWPFWLLLIALHSSHVVRFPLSIMIPPEWLSHLCVQHRLLRCHSHFHLLFINI